MTAKKYEPVYEDIFTRAISDEFNTIHHFSLGLVPLRRVVTVGPPESRYKDYVRKMKIGIRFPLIAVHNNNNNRFWIVDDGIHRLKAYKEAFPLATHILVAVFQSPGIKELL